MMQTISLLRANHLSAAQARAARSGDLERVSRGIYTLAAPSPFDAFAELALKSSHAVVCLSSALFYHGLTLERPYQLWIAMPKGHHAPKNLSVQTEIVTLSGPGYTLGIEPHEISGIKVKIYSPAKCIVDCFKLRHRVGISLAVESLRDGLAKRATTIAEIYEIASKCRMAGVMRPYLESAQA